MRIARMALPILLVLGVVGAVGWWAMRHEAVPVPAPAEDLARAAVAEPTPQPPPPSPEATPKVVLPEPRLDSEGLPPREHSWIEQWPALVAAADAGDGRAACRLAFAAIECIGPDVELGPDDFAHEQDSSQTMLGQRRAVLESVPPELRRYLERAIDAELAERSTAYERHVASRRACQGLPDPTPEALLGWFRQAAQAGHPAALAAWVQGVPFIAYIGMAAAQTPGSGPGFAWVRSNEFQHWRREAAAYRQAGLARGDLALLRAELSPSTGPFIDLVETPDPRRRAAALRAFTLLHVDGPVPSTTDLGLSPADATIADAWSDEWAAASRRRGDAALAGASRSPSAREDCP
ncbi:MAG: hypothetical protein O9303_09445 [Silanimonas sp.]|jgi:hypothetical protein|nr:hypothetical protein [Silanimonas sp.]